MKDKSIYQGIKELEEFRFVKNGTHWQVFEFTDEARGYVFVGNLGLRKGESDENLYKRAEILRGG